MYIKKNIEALKRSVIRTADESGRDPNEITIMAVTKNHLKDSVLQASAAGITCFGENRVQEAMSKYHDIPEADNLHLIGHLQSNKVAKAVELFSWIDSVDSIKLLRKLNHSAEKSEKIIQILFEVNGSGEHAKFGFASEAEVFSAIEISRSLPYIRVRGVMTMGPLGSDEASVRKVFKSLKNTFDKAKACYTDLQIDVLSMGMSGDWVIAVEEGSTLIRVGTSIFGARQLIV
ncbi:MAG: YggS family pyridoxal phosphate-dependent enzyme [Bacteroidetes bacterium]|nr:YggS family pyridoxal phosphate-dependent enzyme [Bacteroidota bacterium]